ncbi:MAG: peptidoglycan bridge formation glycyltransferase FemA/FemB family protein [Syntrophomonadaceae bacterium]|nr:peptidoglycan bridge formation glycyltransferase FemA/FemB family protein [Syntrophomonadaceae bacterium]
MYEIRVLNEGDRERFSEFVSRHPKGHILQTWEWGRVKASTGWQPVPLVMEKSGIIVGAMMILKRRIPLPLCNRCIFYAPRGPVVDYHDRERVNALLEGAQAVARQHGAIFLKIDPDIPVQDTVFTAMLKENGFRKTVTAEGFEGVQPTFVFRLDITPSEDELLANMAPKTRYNIRLAARKGVKIYQVEDKQELKTFYELLKETAQRDKFLIRGYEYFSTIWEELVTRDLARFFLAEYQGKAVAGTLALKLGDKAWYSYGASSNEHRNVMPNYLIQWTMIRWARENGCTLYDFRGVSGDLSEDNPLYGLYRFKKGFNGDFVEFVGEWDKVYSPFFYWLWSKVLPLYYRSVRWLIRFKKALLGR